MEQYKKPVAVEATPKPAVESDFVRSMRLEHEDKLNRLMNGPEKGYKTGLRFRDLTPEERKVYFMGVLYDSPGFVLDNIASRRPVAVEEGEYEEECEVVSPLGSSTKE